MSLYKLLNITVFSIIFLSADSQFYDAPKFMCVQQQSNSNTLSWIKPSVSCGVFSSYHIYFSNSENGTYTLLDSIADEDQTTYDHQNISTNVSHYYYMLSNYICTDMTSRHSDTISDLPIPRPKIISISIENGYPVMKWIPLLERKNVWAYYTAIVDVKIVDTIQGRESEIFIDSNFDVSSEAYYGQVGATDSCGGVKGRSPWSFAHKTIFLSLLNNPCEGNVSMSWTPYVGWTKNDEVGKYEIMVTINSSNEMPVASLDNSTRNYIFSKFDYGDTVSIRVKGTHPSDSKIISYSNSISFISKKTQKPDYFNTLSVSHLDSNTVKINYYSDSNSIPKSFGLRKYISKNNNLVTEVEAMNFTHEGGGYYCIIDSNSNHDRQISYQIIFVDSCDNASESSFSNDNYLDVEQYGLYSNILRWSDIYFTDTMNATVEKHEVYMSLFDHNFTKIEEFDNTHNEYNHNIEKYVNSDGNFCYYIQSLIKIDTPSSHTTTVRTIISNTKCIKMRTVLWMPNAFKVGGYTPVYKPKLVFWDNSIFSMDIFDRWGNNIFHTNDPVSGWNGVTNKGVNSSEDTYFYKVTYLSNDGTEINKTGSFLLIR